MKRILIGLVLLSLLISGYANAVTYTFTGDIFTSVNGAYTTSMQITGTLITSAPIPPNYSGDLSGLLTSWSFNDGVQTIDNTNGEFNPVYPFQVWTDASGNIDDASLWVNISPIATAVGEADYSIGFDFLAQYATTDIVCTAASGGVCTGRTLGPAYGSGYANTVNAVWVTSGLPAPPIPATSQWSLMLLIFLLGIFGLTRVKRKA